MADKLNSANFYGRECVISSIPTGGTSGGMAVTTQNRWLRFNFDDPSHRSLKILGGTSIGFGDNIVNFEEDTVVNLTDYLGEEGADYYVFINAEGRIIASLVREPADGYVFIGQFHTLCNGVSSNVTGLIAVETGTSVGTVINIQNYQNEDNSDFYQFYAKTADSINAGTPYAVATVIHPLAGFNTGDILPESVWCLNFHPSCKNWDGMVYCNGAKIAVDIYLQSGTSFQTKSEYGAVHTVNRQWINFADDAYCVEKNLPTFPEFMILSQGSNQKTVIQGASDYSTVGGHVDTAGRRMISFIGCEDCIGYISQNTAPCSSIKTGTAIQDLDGRGIFGLSNDNSVYNLVGGSYDISNVGGCGSRFMNYATISEVFSSYGNRCICGISIV